MKSSILLHHCILNMNVRAPGISVWRGVVDIVLQALWMTRAEFLQLPCPETPYLGLRRWWFVKEQYDNVMYRKFTRKLATSVSDILSSLGVDRVKLIGLGLSPSCAYRETQSDQSWGGKPREVDLTKNIRPGMGVWSEELVKALTKFHTTYYDLPPHLIYPQNRGEYAYMYPKTVEAALIETVTELGLNADRVDLKKYAGVGKTSYDMRSGQNLVAPLEIAWEENNMLSSFVEKGYGLVLVPNLKHVSESGEFYLDVLATQLENQARAGQNISFIESWISSSSMYRRFLEILDERKLIKLQ